MGTISVESKPGEGTCFMIILPEDKPVNELKEV
jgi:signal transduction histidine kinase